MARLIDQIVGHQATLQKFLQAFQEGRLPATFLFVGPVGVGKFQAAKALAQALLCESTTEIAPCGRCGGCLRVAKNQHESLLQIEPEKNVIKIESSREILDFLSFRSLTARRVVIIDQAEKLNPQAANSLLKILEEPPPGTFFFLIAPTTYHVLPTLRSRSQVLRFKPISIEDMKRVRPSAAPWALRASFGSFMRLHELSSADEAEIRELATLTVRSWLEAKRAFLFDSIRDTVKDKAVSSSYFRHLALFFRDALHFQMGSTETLIQQGQMALLKELSQRPEAALLECFQRALKLETALQQNRDAQLTFEEFWIETQAL